MTIKFDNYVRFDGGSVGPLRTASREDAQAHFDRMLENRSYRLEQLARLTARHGVVLGSSDHDLQKLNDWVREAAVALAPRRELPAPWDSLVVDLAIHLGELLIRRAEYRVNWSLLTSHPKAAGYHRPVVTGFRLAVGEHFYVDPAFMTASYLALAARRGQARADYFVFLLSESLALV